MEYTFVQGCKYLIGIPQISKERAISISQKFNLSMPLARTLITRNMQDDETIQDFLLVHKELHVHDPILLKDALKSVERIERAIEKREKILIFGDYDVDGITSSSLMMMGLLSLGAQVNFYLPNRVKDGYGISKKIVQKAADAEYSLIITVDNGITAFEPAALAKELGVDLIITDHHKPHDHVPDAYAIINPHQDDCPYPYKYFAGVGVAFKILSLLYTRKDKKIPGKVIELLLLGTVADVVPLTGENRYWVRYGLSYVNQHESYALQVLKQNSKYTKPTLASLDVGFSITPQINALGRLDDPRQGVEFLIGQNKEKIDDVGKILLELNQARKEIEQAIIREIVQKVETGQINIAKENVIIAWSQHWPAGVIGLVASRIVGLYGKPTILFHLTQDGIAKGSCRSISAFNMFNALHDSKELMISFGGHAQAAGLSLKFDDVAILKERLEKKIAEELTAFDLTPKVITDSHAQLSDFSSKFIHDLELFEPFGHENTQPLFYIKDVVLVKSPQLLKDLHVKCLVFADGVIKSVIFFNRPELYEVLVNCGQESFDVIGQVSQNHWNGNVTVEITGMDIVLKNERLT